MPTNPLLQVKRLGQPIGLDSMRRSHITAGGSKKLIDAAGVSGETSNPHQNDRVAARIWSKDASLWKRDAKQQAEIRERLGWLTVAADMQKQVADLCAFGDEIKNAGFKYVVLCGMGGSSLCVEVCRDAFGSARGYPKLFVLDTTDPATIRTLERKMDVRKTLFVIASKSGDTIETLAHYHYFAAKAPPQSFVAITDAGTALEQLARDRGFRRVFLNPADIGGRYSALSYFGLVPAALMGVDIERLLTRAEEMARACASAENPGLRLGVALATLAQHGRDKITLMTSPGIVAFGAWAEQLVAESTGKEGKGLVPIADEPPAPPSAYGADRVFVYLRLAKARNAALDRRMTALEEAGQPVIRLHLRDAYDLGAEFFRWEFAIAVAGARLGVNPFDQPNVQESKENTARVLAQQAAGSRQKAESSRQKAEKPAWKGKQFEVYSTEKIGKPKTLRDALHGFMEQARAGDYLALMAYVQQSPKNHAALQALRGAARRATKLATTLGYGPRFLHSTGQLHKGGPDNVLAIQITADDDVDAKIPGKAYSFSALKRAQASGDWQALKARGRRALRVHLRRGATLGQLVKEFQNAMKRDA